MDKNTYFAFLKNKLVNKEGFLSEYGITAYTKKEAVRLLRLAKKRAGYTYWNHTDYIRWYDCKEMKWKTIFPDKF